MQGIYVSIFSAVHRVSCKKTTRYLIVHNGKCWPIFKIISLSDLPVNV